MAEPSCSRQPTECMAWSRRLPGVWLIAGRPRRSATRSRIWSASGSSASPTGTPMATMRTGWPTTRSTSGCWGPTRWPARAWRRSRRSRASRTTRGASRSIGWGASWRRRSSSGIPAGARAGGRDASHMDLDPTRTRAEVFGPRESSPAASWAPVEDGGVVAQQPAPLRRTGSPCRDRIGLLDGDCRRVARVYPDRPAASLPHLSWSASRCRISQKTLTQSLGAGCRNSRIVGYQGVSVRPSIQRQSWANTSAPPTCGTSLRRF